MMFPWLFRLTFGGLILVVACPAVLLPGLENSRLDPSLQGRVLLDELNCIACHTSPSGLTSSANKAPRLGDVGARINPAYLQRFIRDPHGVKPGTTMPDVMSHLSAEAKQRVAEAITHYLLSLKPPRFAPTVPDAVAAGRGETLFHASGCVACHSPRDESGKELMANRSVPLGPLEDKYCFKSLVEFLRRPHATRPSGRMPDMRLQGREVEQIAHYLLRNVVVPGPLAYTRYRGQVWEGMDSDEVEKDRGGHVADFNLESFKEKHHNSAIRYEGYLQVATAGTYAFYLEMNGGYLWLNQQVVVELAPSNRRGVKKIKGEAELNRGWNRIVFDYYHTGRNPRLSLEMEGPEYKRRPPSSSMFSISDEPIAVFMPWTVDVAKVAAGRRHFTALGCIACHDDIRGSVPAYPSLAGLDPGKGCLGTSKGAWAHYGLDASQRKKLAQMLPNAAGMKLTDAERINHTLVSFNCIACHDREGLGGVAPERNAYFTGTKEALGNQGRIPPPLTHVGAKLKPEWMREVMLRGGRQRAYLSASMPQFGESQVAHLVELFARVDRLEDADIPDISEPEPLKQAGHQLIGTEGLSCVACHDFNGQQAAGPGALDLVHSTERLQKNWFHLYMRNPSRFHQTVIMPGYWPGGVALRKDILDGDSARQIEGLWRYLEDGIRARNPRGLSRKSRELRVTDVAVSARGRGPAGYRGMAVGYPSGINIAFDCEQMSLRQLWKHAFVHTNPGSFSPRGSERITFPPGIPFHRLKSMDDHWPYKGKTDYLFPFDHGYQFRGYYHDALKRPTFMYQYGEVKVEDYFQDLLDEAGKAYFRRRFTFDAERPQALFYFRVASGKSIQQRENAFVVDQLTIRFISRHTGLVREGEPRELLIPLELPAGRSTVDLEYRW
ncbi:MAG: hypothetical protein VCG02_13800 [Verrucomicrobiota bacterium]